MLHAVIRNERNEIVMTVSDASMVEFLEVLLTWTMEHQS